jgi:hypothetical protein
MGFGKDLVFQLTVLWNYKSILEPKNSMIINMEMFGFFFLCLPFDVKDTHISFLKFDDSASQRTFHSDIVEYNRMHGMGKVKITLNHRSRMRFLAQCISRNVGLAKMIMYLQVVVFDQLEPSSLPHIQLRLSKDIFEAFVVGVDIVEISKQIMPPNLGSMDHNG